MFPVLEKYFGVLGNETIEKEGVLASSEPRDAGRDREGDDG